MKKDDIEVKIDNMADRLDSKLEKIHDRLNAIEVVTVQNTTSLELHMLRTDLAEKRLELIEEEIKPVLEGMNFLKIMAKIGSFIAAAIYTVTQWFK